MRNVTGLVVALLALSLSACASQGDPTEQTARRTEAIGPSMSTKGLVFYRRTGGDNFYTGNVDTSGGFVTLAGTAGVSSAWTHVVGLDHATTSGVDGDAGGADGSGSVFLYNSGSRDAAIGTIDTSGVFHQTHSWPGSGSPAFGTWDQIVQLGVNGDTLFYRWDAAGAIGSGALLQMNPYTGSTVTDRGWNSGFAQWTSIVAGVDGANSAVFYDKSSGALVFGTFRAPAFDLDQRATTIATGYDIVASDGSTVAFYNSSTGALEWGVPSLSTGTYIRKGTATYGSGMTQLVGRQNHEYTFLRKSDGYMLTTTFNADGTHADQHVFTASTGWDIMASAGDYYFRLPN